MTGNRGRRVVYAALAVGTGSVRLDLAGGWNQQTFQDHLRGVRATWRGWRVVLFLDRGSPHTAKATRALARRLRVGLRYLPTATPELNPVEGLWRYLKGRVLANEPTPDLDASLHRAFDDLRAMSPVDRLRLAGVLSGNFWLST
jgi:transposase